MSPYWWFLIGPVIWIFVALTSPLVLSLIFKPKDRDEARELVQMCWAWPILVPVLLVAGIVIGIGYGGQWLIERYVNVMIGGKGPSAPVEGRVVE